MPTFAKIFELKRALLITVFLFLTVVSFAQSEKLVLSGVMDMNTGESIPYAIFFTESGGTIKGYSITYKEPDDTKTIIEGFLDRKAKTLSFKETEIVYSHDRKKTKAYMCLADAHLDCRTQNGGKIFKGSLNSNEADRTACTGGTITFSNELEVMHVLTVKEKFDTVIAMGRKPKDVPVVVKPQPVEEPVQVITEKITKGIEKAYEWHSDTVIIDVWDGGNVDGDKVTLMYNDKAWLSGYSLVKQKRQVRIPISKSGEDIISIIADNEGSDPPNTATMMLTDGTTRYNVEAYNNKGSRALIKVKRVH